MTAQRDGVDPAAAALIGQIADPAAREAARILFAAFTKCLEGLDGIGAALEALTPGPGNGEPPQGRHLRAIGGRDE